MLSSKALAIVVISSRIAAGYDQSISHGSVRPKDLTLFQSTILSAISYLQRRININS